MTDWPAIARPPLISTSAPKTINITLNKLCFFIITSSNINYNTNELKVNKKEKISSVFPYFIIL